MASGGKGVPGLMTPNCVWCGTPLDRECPHNHRMHPDCCRDAQEQLWLNYYNSGLIMRSIH